MLCCPSNLSLHTTTISTTTTSTTPDNTWYENIDPIKGVYYFNRALGKSQWNHPGPNARIKKFQHFDDDDDDVDSEEDEAEDIDEHNTSNLNNTSGSLLDDDSDLSSSMSPSPRSSPHMRRKRYSTAPASPRNRDPIPTTDNPAAKSDSSAGDDDDDDDENPKQEEWSSLAVNLSEPIDDRPAEMLLIKTPKPSFHQNQTQKQTPNEHTKTRKKKLSPRTKFAVPAQTVDVDSDDSEEDQKTPQAKLTLQSQTEKSNPQTQPQSQPKKKPQQRSFPSKLAGKTVSFTAGLPIKKRNPNSADTANNNKSNADRNGRRPSIRKSETWHGQLEVAPEEVWYRNKDRRGRTYYFNRATRQSVWKEPKGECR